MTLHQDLTTAEATELMSNSVHSVKKPQIDRKHIRYLALLGGKDAARDYAAATADALNAGLRARLEAVRVESVAMAQRLSGQIADYDEQADARAGILWRRLVSSDPSVRMTKMERVQCTFYIALTLIALGVATYALAQLLTELDVIEKLSENIWRAVAYAFPVILASAGVASMATLHDEEKIIEQRTMRVLKSGTFVFLMWIAMTALVFVGEEGGFNPNDILNAANDPFAAVPAEPDIAAIKHGYSILRALFPSGLTSSVLIVVHIVAEVLIAAGLTARVVLMGRKTRETTAYDCPRAVKARQNASALEQKKQTHVNLIGDCIHQIAKIDAVKASFVADVLLMASSEERLAQASRAAATLRAEQRFLNDIEETPTP